MKGNSAKYLLGKLENRRAMRWLGHFSLPLVAGFARVRLARMRSSFVTPRDIGVLETYDGSPTKPKNDGQGCSSIFFFDEFGFNTFALAIIG